jgi:hypothetical protein
VYDITKELLLLLKTKLVEMPKYSYLKKEWTTWVF